MVFRIPRLTERRSDCVVRAGSQRASEAVEQGCSSVQQRAPQMRSAARSLETWETDPWNPP